MHECFANHDIRVFRDLYIHGRPAAIRKKKKHYTEEINKAILLTF